MGTHACLETDGERGPTGNRADRPEVHGRQVAGGAVPHATARLDDKHCGVRRRRSVLARETETCALVVMLPPTFAIVAAAAPMVALTFSLLEVFWY